MAWLTCPHCGFTQIPAAQCLKCQKRLDKPVEPGSAAPPPGAARTSSSLLPALRSVPRQYLAILGALALLVVAAVLVWNSRAAVAPLAPAPLPAATPEPWTLDLTGRWEGKIATTLPGTPPRPALREVFVETDRSGRIVGAGVTLTDPGRGGAGAGYLTVTDGQRRVREVASAVAASPAGAAVALDFIPFAPWVPRRERLWKAVEGQRRDPEETRYVLLESVEKDYLVQAGVNDSGFLSYLYASPTYARARGEDVLSTVIHPEPESSLRGFRGLVWDLSGSADFVGLHVNATIAGPAGTPDRLVLRRTH